MLSWILAGAIAQAAPMPTVDDPFILSCEPARTMGRIMQLLPPSALADNLENDFAADSMARALFMDPSRARALGLDPDGAFELVMAGEGMRLRIPLEPAGPGALAEHLEMVVQPDGTIDIPGGPSVRVDGDALVADTLAIDPGVPPLLQGLPDTSGCQVHVPLLDKGMRLGILVPDDGTAPLLIRARGPEPPPAVLHEVPSTPVGGSSHATPFLVATLGVSPRALLEDPTIQAALAGVRGATMDVRAMDHSSVQVLPGATLALFMSGDGPQGVVVLPVSNQRGRDVRVRSVTRAIGRMAEREGARVTRMGPNGLRIEGPKRTFTIAVQADRVVVGTHTDAALHAATGRGDPWVRPSLENLARTHAVSMIMDTAAMFPGMRAVSVELGLGATEQAWQLELRLSGDPEMLTMLMASLRQGLAGAGLPEP